ncbi:hypothetical protein ACFQL9_13080 [Halobaculum lipolyticum]|uniref:Uncharacterized protein n=1 Tax=Halobaculum lipolyticum TaxID=3032001 RepID=A0ABD5WEK3_9EURY
MNFEDLEWRKQTERETGSLQSLPDDWYDDLVAYLDDDALDDPERRSAEAIADGLVDRRLGKIVKLASWDAADAPTDTSPLTTPEAALYADLVECLERFRAETLAPAREETSE